MTPAASLPQSCRSAHRTTPPPAPGEPARSIRRAGPPGTRAGAVALLTISLLLVALPLGCARRSAADPRRTSPLSHFNVETNDPFDQPGSPAIRPGTHLAAARLAESRNDLPRAAAQYRLVLDKEPENAEALYRLGVVYSKLGDRRALDVWKRYLQITGGSAVAWANLGFCHELFDELDAAETAYRKGLAVDPDSAECRVNYGMLLARRGNDVAAEEQLLAALPPHEAFYNIGSVRERRGDRAGAIVAYRKSLAHLPDFAPARDRLAALSAAAVPAAPAGV